MRPGMHIEEGKNLLLFRYSNYRETDFLKEHLAVIDKKGYTWLLKAGKRSAKYKIDKVMADGGFIILRSPTPDGGKFYAAVCTEFREATPSDEEPFPAYYKDFINDLYETPSCQWFKIKEVYAIDDNQLDNIVLNLSHEKIVNVLKTTRTAVMFLYSTGTIELKKINN